MGFSSFVATPSGAYEILVSSGSTLPMLLFASNLRVFSPSLYASFVSANSPVSLLGVIDALGIDYNTVLDTPVDGEEGKLNIDVGINKDSAGNPNDFSYIFQVKDSSNKEKVGLISSYDSSTGYLSIEDDGSTVELEVGDEVVVEGHFYFN